MNLENVEQKQYLLQLSEKKKKINTYTEEDWGK